MVSEPTGGSVPEPAFLHGFYLPRQELTNWCWAAVTVSMTQHAGTGRDWTQCEVATVRWREMRRLDDAETCCGPAMVVHTCDKPIQLTIPLRQVGLLRQHVAGKLEFSQVAEEIRAGRPIACHLRWTNDFPNRDGHFVALVGYKVSGAGRRVWVHDPTCSSDGLDTTDDLPYDEMFEYGEDQGVWDHSYLIEYRKKAERSVAEAGTDR